MVGVRDRCETAHRPGNEEMPSSKKIKRDVCLSESVVKMCPSVDSAAAALLDRDCVASFVRRPLLDTDGFADYVASRPEWPDCHEFHPLEATWDRVVLIEFSSVSDNDDPLSRARGYGKGLPPKNRQGAPASRAIAEVTSVLPDNLAQVVVEDASKLLLSLHRHTGRRLFIMRLELVRGDTCQRWHCDQNFSRSLVTYAGPGTLCAHDRGVTRATDGRVVAVCEEEALQGNVGDFVLLKGGTWDGLGGRGAAHRAPTIGPVPRCTQHRLVMKVDVSDDV